MASINNVCLTNIAPATTTSIFNASIWSVSRAMKKAGWYTRASSDGTTKSVSDDPNSDKWGGNGPITNAGGSAASITTSADGLATITGLSGLVDDETTQNTDKGRIIVITGSGSGNNKSLQIQSVNVAGNSVVVDAFYQSVTAPDANNGSLTWEIRDPSTIAYPTALDGVIAWILMQGPCEALKVPFTAAPSGPFVTGSADGENVTQSSSGFQGQIVGIEYDAASSTGLINLKPRVRGSGTGPWGLTTGQTFTGATSGSTVVQNGTAVEIRQEFVFCKSANQTNGIVFRGNADPVADSAQRFVTLASSAGCTATVPPGGGGTGNAFPADYGTLCHGTGTTIAAGSIAWKATSGAATFGNFQVSCADAIQETDYTADGSFWWAGTVVENPAGGMLGHAFMVCDDGEPLDFDPVIYFRNGGSNTLYANNRTTALAASVAGLPGYTSANTAFTASTTVLWLGWWRRAITVANGDAVVDSGANYQDFEAGSEFVFQTAIRVMAAQTSNPKRRATAIASTIVAERFEVESVQINRKMTKGFPRWMRFVQGSNTGATYIDDDDGFRWMQAASSNIAISLGPYHPTATPILF